MKVHKKILNKKFTNFKFLLKVELKLIVILKN